MFSLLHNYMELFLAGAGMGGEVTTNPKEPEGMGWRIAVSIVTFFGLIIAAIIWLFFYAGSYNVYQNIAVIIVIILACIAIMGATWASWGMKQSSWWRER